MRKIITLKNGGAVIDISPLTDIDFAIIYHGRECLILENMLDGEFEGYYNPNIKLKQSSETKTSCKKKQLKAKTIKK
jgi:hypothetical protein